MIKAHITSVLTRLEWMSRQWVELRKKGNYYQMIELPEWDRSWNLRYLKDHKIITTNEVAEQVNPCKVYEGWDDFEVIFRGEKKYYSLPKGFKLMK